MRRSLSVVCGVLAVLGLPAVAMGKEGTTTVLQSTAHGTLTTSKAAHLVFSLPAGSWTQAKNDDGTPSLGVYSRRSSIGGHSCAVNVFVSGRGQNRRPTLTPGKLPTKQVRHGTDGAYHWYTARITGGPAAPAPYAGAYRRAPSSAKWKYATITAGIGFVEPTTSACHRSGARINLRPLVTSFRVAADVPAATGSPAMGTSVVATAQPEQSLSPFVSQFGGVTAWSEQESGGRPGLDRYYLTVAEKGTRRRLPIPPRLGVAFDVDLGPAADGSVVAVYSRCSSEPDVITVRDKIGDRVFTGPYPAWTAGRGCDLYRFDFKTNRESKIRGASTSQASEMLPSIWRDHIAFARVYENRSGSRGRYPYLYTRTLGDGARSIQLPGGSRGENGLPGPVALDLYGKRLAFSWAYSTEPARTGKVSGATELRLDTIGGSHTRLGKATFDYSRSSGEAAYLSPTGTRGRIVYGFQRVRFHGENEPTSTTRLISRYRISNGKRTNSGAPGPLLSSVSVDDRAVAYGVSNGWSSSQNAKVLTDPFFRYGG